MVEAHGFIDGTPAVVRANVAHPEAYQLTAIPVVAAVMQVLDGTARRPGLWMMGHLVDPLRLMKDMADMGARCTGSERIGKVDQERRSKVKMTAQVLNSRDSHQVILATGGQSHEISIPPKGSGFGSSVNGGEALFLALATCYCNDVYREAGKLGISVQRVEVEVQGDFPADGAPAENVTYRAGVLAEAEPEAIRALMRHVDTVAEIQNSLRAATPVRLSELRVIEANSF